MATIRVLYFASLAETLNCREETFNVESLPINIEQLKEKLAERGGNWNNLQDEHIKAAVNQTLAKDASKVEANDEVAFFPPVTGG